MRSKPPTRVFGMRYEVTVKPPGIWQVLKAVAAVRKASQLGFRHIYITPEVYKLITSEHPEALKYEN